MSAAASPSGDDSVSALIWPVIGAWVAGALALLSSYARNWLLSGSGLETLLLLSGPSLQSDVPSWVLVLVLNIVYAVASTSWLLHIVFASFCWPLVLATSITQYVLISRFTRGRLRWLLKEMHFHRDKVAFFSFPVLIIDTGISGFVAVQGVTVSMLTLTVEVHSIDLALNIGQGHEVHVHTNSLEIKLFRRIVIGEIFAAHKCLEDERESAFEDHDPLDEDAHAHNKFHEPSADKIAKDNIDHETSIKHKNQAPDSNESIAGEPENNHSTALDDEDAELRYTQLLNDIHTGGRLYQMRERLKAAVPDREHTDPESIELRAILSTELRRTGLSPPAKCDRVTTSKLATLFPEPDIFQYVPSALRALLWLASHTHPIECPSISVAGSGHWLSDLLAQLVFRRHSTDDERIVELEREISEWLSVGEYCVDLRNITALGQVPLRSAYNIKSEIRSTGIAISRVDVESESSAQMASLAGVDGSFVIPTCLLPHHTHLIPPEPSPVEVKAVQEKKREKAADAEEARAEEETVGTMKADVKIVEPQPSEDQLEDESEEEPEDLDALGVLMSIRATLPAHFDESCLSFAATLSKAAQMLEIEESIVDPPTPMPYDENLDPTDSFREKFSRRSKQLGSVMKHPLQTAQGAFQREIRKGTVMRVNGAWFAKWTNKILEQLAWLNGDVGYTFEIPVSLKPYR